MVPCDSRTPPPPLTVEYARHRGGGTDTVTTDYGVDSYREHFAPIGIGTGRMALHVSIFCPRQPPADR